jgi:hypothetical protein
MTQLLEKALQEVRKLPETDQNVIAALILEELADEQRWEALFARSPATLTRLVEKAEADIQLGRVRPGGMDDL